MADLMSGGGVDSSIALRAGQGVAPPANPLEQIGKFAQVSNLINNGQIQQQTIQSNNMSLATQMKQLAAAHLAPLIKQGLIKNEADLTSALAGLEHFHGIISHPINQVMLDSVRRGGDFNNALQDIVVAGMQEPANVGKALYDDQFNVDQGSHLQPSRRGAPGTSGAGIVTPAGGIIEKFPGPEQQTGYTERPATAKEAAELKIPPGTLIKVPNVLQAGQTGVLPLYGPAAQRAVGAPSRDLPGQPDIINVPGRGNQPVPIFDPITGDRLIRSPTPNSSMPRGVPDPNKPVVPGQRAIAAPGSAAEQAAQRAYRSGPLDGDVGPVPPLSPKDAATVQNAPRVGGMSPFVAKPPAGMVESQETSAKAYDAALINDSQFQRRTFPLREAMTALSKTSTGPGTETTNYIKSFLQARAPDTYKKLVGQEGSDKVKNYDLSVKYLADWVAQQGGSQRSDMAQTLASTSSPSTHISQAAARQVLAAALGLENMQHAAATEFTRTQGGQANGGQFLTWMNQNFTPNADPHGYAWGSIPRDTRAEILKAASPEEKKRLYDSYKRAVDLNLTPAIK